MSFYGCVTPKRIMAGEYMPTHSLAEYCTFSTVTGVTGHGSLESVVIWVGVTGHGRGWLLKFPLFSRLIFRACGAIN
jgi:hypothetical protein